MERMKEIVITSRKIKKHMANIDGLDETKKQEHLGKLDKTFETFAKKYPNIYKGIVDGSMDMTRFEAMAETAGVVMEQQQNRWTNGPPAWARDPRRKAFD